MKEYKLSQSKTGLGGSLPRFLTAFIGGKKLSDRQAEELKRLVNENRG